MLPLRLLVRPVCLALVACSALPTCVVSEERYARSRTAWDAEHSAHENTARELVETERRLAETDSERDKLEALSGLKQSELAQVTLRAEQEALDYERLDKARDEQAMLVREMQSQAVLTEKQLALLREMLGDAEQHRDSLRDLDGEARRASALVRDLALNLHNALTGKGVELELYAGAPRLQFPRAAFISARSGELSPLAEQWLAEIARAASGHSLQAVEFAENDLQPPRDTGSTGTDERSAQDNKHTGNLGTENKGPGKQAKASQSAVHRVPWTHVQATLERLGLQTSYTYPAESGDPAMSPTEAPEAGIALDLAAENAEQHVAPEAPREPAEPVVWITLRLGSQSAPVPR